MTFIKIELLPPLGLLKLETSYRLQGDGCCLRDRQEDPKPQSHYGTDLFFVDPDVFSEQTKMMERLLRWYEPVEILRIATGTAGELFNMSGLRNPYPDGDLGVVKESANADLLDINTLEDSQIRHRGR